jgi:hypothetical protein
MSAGVSTTTPLRYHNETVFGRITSNGQGISGVPMTSYWYYKTTTSGCTGTSDATGTASCTREISSATAGYFVRVHVVMTYSGQTYSADTGFTPQ